MSIMEWKYILNKLYVFIALGTLDKDFDPVIAESLEKAIEYHHTLFPNTTYELEHFKNQTYIRYMIATKGSDGRIYYGTWLYEIQEYALKEGIL